MSTRLFCLLPMLAALAACAHQGVVTTPGSTRSNASYVGLGGDALSADASADYMKHEFQALSAALSVQGGNAWQLLQFSDGSIRLQVQAAAGFDLDSAELRPSILEDCAKIARIAQGFDKTVIHLAVGASDSSQAEYSQSLSDRRAAALAAYFAGQGISEVRMRFEGTVDSQKANNLMLVIKPVIAGAEPMAWMPPS